MKLLISIIFTTTLYFQLHAQDLPVEIHRNDSIWIQDVQNSIENIVDFKTHVVQFNFNENENFIENLDSLLIQKIYLLDKIYKKELNNFRNGYVEFIEKQQTKKLYGYTYLDMIMQIEKFSIYPNIYAILLNPTRTYIDPKLDLSTKKEGEKIVTEIKNFILKLNKKEQQQLDRYREEFEKGIPIDFHKIFQGDISKEERTKLKTIDFLIFMNRLIRNKNSG